jgi:hypothetical protein
VNCLDKEELKFQYKVKNRYSIYEDLEFVRIILNRVKELTDINETIFESYNELNKLSEEINSLLISLNEDEDKETELRHKMTVCYFALENYMSYFYKDYKDSINLKKKINKLAFQYLDSRSPIVKSKQLLDQSFMPYEFIDTLRLLNEGTKYIGFKLIDREDIILDNLIDRLNDITWI